VRTVLCQIRTFWLQLSWPDVETSYVFISRILDDVCRAIIFYADKMCAKAEEEKKVATIGSKNLHCTKEQCLAINNIDFVKSYINQFVSDLGIDKILEKLEEQKGVLVADACRKTIRTLMKNSIENVENQIFAILEEVGSKMAPTIEKFLFEGQVISQDTDKKNLLAYLDENLIFLKHRLYPANFERVLSVMWAMSSSSLSDILHKSIEKKKPPEFFLNLYETFKILLNFFYGEKVPEDTNLLSTRKLLQIFSSSPVALLDTFYKERWIDQNKAESSHSPLGSVTVKFLITASHLRVHVMNCKNLKPCSQLQRSQSQDLSATLTTFIRNSRLNKSTHNISRTLESKVDSVKDCMETWRLSLQEARIRAHLSSNNGMSSPYVTVKLVPGPSGCPTYSKVKTAIQTRTLFPIFDETFDLILPEGVNRDKLYLLLSVKDLGPLGDRILLGEAIIPVSEIKNCGSNTDFELSDQVELPLSFPGPSLLYIITALQTRGCDLSREMRKWVNTQRRRILLP